MTKDGHEKAQVMSCVKCLVKHYGEDAEWWVDVQKRCRKFIGKRTSMNVDEFQRIFALEVSINGQDI